MGMTWSEYKAYREKKKKEEEQTKKQQKTSSNKVEKTITNNANNQEKNNNLINTISQNNRLPLNNENANKIALNTPSLQDIVSKNNSSKIVQSNNNPLAKQIEEQNANKPLQKAIEEQKKKPKTTQKEPSTWERIMDNFRIGGYGGITGVAQTGYRDIRDIDNMYTDASSSLRHQVLSTFFGEHGENFARAVDDKLYKWNDDRNQIYNYALGILNQEQQKNSQAIQQNIEEVKKTGDKIGTKFTELSPSIGQNALGMLATAVDPALGFTYYKMSSEASYYDDALNRGMTEEQAKAYSKIMSYVEAGTETLSASNIVKGGKALKTTVTGAKTAGVKVGLKAGFNVLKEGAKEEVVSSFKNALKSYGIGIIEEAFQEGITEPLQELTAMATAGKDKADWSNMPQRIFNSAFDGALSSLVLAGANMGISSCQGVVTNLKEGKPVSEEQFKTSLQDASKELDAGKMLTDNFENEVNKLKTELQTQEAQQNKDNKVTNQEIKTSQNGFSQAEKTEALRQEARNKLESIKQNYDENSYNQMQEFIETAPSEKALNQVISDLNKEAEKKQVAPLKTKQEVQLPMKQQETQNKSFEDVAFEAMNNYESNEVESPLKNRDMDSIGKQTKVNAYQYDNPKVKPYFQEMAQQMGEDLAYIASPENRSTKKGGGTKLSTSTKAMDILHNEQGYSYNQIAQGLQNIIDDKGSENNAISKKIELVIDEQLRNGYTNALGKNIEPNQEYINTITEQYSLAEQPQQNNFKYEQSDNSKIDTFRQDASKYWDNSEKTTKLVNTIEKIINDKGYNIRLDDTLGDNVNGRIVTNNQTGETEITINPNSNRKGEFIIGHELTHAIETDEMTKLVKKRMEKDGELRNAVEDLKKLYGTDDINAEVLADISGQLFGNQEFINNLSIEKPSVFKRIYDKIISLANKITGNSNEALFIKDLKNKWEQAYRENNNTINEEQYSIGGKKGMDNAIKSDPKYSLMRYYYNKAQQMAKQNIDNEQIRQQTNWFQDKNGDWKFEFSDKDMALKSNIKLQEGKTYKLNDVLEHDTLFEIYPELKDYNVKIKEMDTNVNGSFNKNTHTINLKKMKTKIATEGTLIHEIQHAIQNIEAFENGRNPKLSKLAYYKSLGEIEADNTKQRFLQEKRGNLDRNKVAPESSKTNPEHRKLNNYLQNRTIIDKMKDGLYNYLSEKTKNWGDSDEISEENMEQTYQDNSKSVLQTGEKNRGQIWDRIEDSEKGSFNLSKNHKEQQNKIIQDNNPMDKALGEHTWINSADDIKTYQEAIEEFGEIDNITPDFTAEDVKKALDTGKMTVYSSYPIEQGTFVTPSKMEAQSYAGKGQVYSKEISLTDVAWIDEVQGQYAKVEAQNNNTNITTDNQGRQLSEQQQEYFKNSKARDEQGNLLEVYHGTNNDFTIFDKSYLGTASGDVGFLGDGFYLATHKGEAGYYGSNVMSGYVDIKNPFNIKELNKYNGKVLEGEDSSIGVRIYNLVSMNEQWKDITIDGYSYEEIANETRNFLENAKIKKLGDIEDFSGNLTGIMWEINYKGNSKKTESIPNYKQEAILADSLNEHIRKKFGYINSQEILQNITHENRYNSNIKSFSEVLQDNGYDSIVQGTPQTTDEIVIFNSNQFKNIDNKTPTDNPDIRYSKQNNNWQNYLESNYKSEGTTTDLRDIRLPMKEKQEIKLPMKQENTQQTQEQNNNTKGENINWTEIERPEENRKFRKHYKSIIESDNTTAEAKSIAKDLMGTDTYVPETNKGQLAQADQRITTSSPEVELQSLLSRSMNGEKISSVDIAVGERLIQYFSKTGSKQQLQEAIQATAMAGTSAGQTVQALSMLNHQTPRGQATWIQRSVDKMNKELAKKKGGTITTDADGNLQVINKQGKDITNKVDLFNLTPEMIDKIMNSENQEQMYKNIDEVYEELGQQVPKGMLEKIDSWRYFSMLANARTHIRNMVGNLAMGKTQRIKDKLAGGIEDVVSKFNPEMERTKTLRRADAKTKDFAKQDFKNMEVQSRLELNENKYNPQSRLQNARRTFKSNAMENTLGRLFNLNDKLLSAEDGIGLKAGYQKALADYITANKIDVDNITDKQLNKARNYAVQQAKEATFHQANAIASAVAQFENKNLATKLFTGAVLPFKKTPMNVAKAGMEYSPLQIAKSATVDLVNLRKGNISVNQYIDNLSKGMTGTGIALVGYALANAGILKASGGDDKDKEKYEEEQGKQSYSIQIAGKTYSLDWLAPTGIPLFIGAETHKLFNQEETEKSTEKKSEEDRLNQAIKGASNLLNAGATAINPMSEMSMISGLTSALSSYNTSDNLGSLGNIITNAGKSYVNQFFPTLMGQVAKTTDKYERTTKSTATGTIGKAVDQTINQIKNKIPGLRQTLPIKTDIWGKELKQEVNLPLRAVNNFINPATVKEVSTDKVDMELNKLYEENHSSSLLPDILTKTVQLNKQTYRLSNKEYAEFTKNYGQTSHKLIENFIKTSDYNKLTQEQKETAISNIYSYAKEQNKLDYAKKVNETVKPSTLYTTMKEIEKNGGKQSEYLSYLAKTKGMSKESEKNKVLADSNYSNKTKEIIYTNGTGKDDNLYNDLLSKSNIDMTEYLKYKDKLSSKAFSADKDKNGKTIAGSAKTKVINYLNNNITGFGNRLLIAGNSYALQNSEKQKLAEYINSTVSTREERLEIYKQLDKNFTIKDGKVYMRVSKR